MLIHPPRITTEPQLFKKMKNEKKNKKASSHEEGFLGLLILHHPPAKFLTETLETVFLHSYNEV